MRNYNGYGYSFGEVLAPIAATAAVVGMIGIIGYEAYEDAQTRTVAGVVLQGADGKDYVLPDDPTQPVYADKQDCVDDVTAHMAEIKKATGGTVDPNAVCQPADQYPVFKTIYTRGQYVGPVIGKKYEWENPAWIPTRTGTFAATGEDISKFPQDEAPAPEGAHVGEHESTEVHPHGGFGGGEGGEGGEGGHGFGGGHGE